MFNSRICLPRVQTEKEKTFFSFSQVSPTSSLGFDDVTVHPTVTVAQNDRELFCKIDQYVAQCALDLLNCKMKNEKKRKAGAKRVKEDFDRLARQDTSDQAEEKRREIVTIRCKQINSGKGQFISARC
jgi:hypothetical protein